MKSILGFIAFVLPLFTYAQNQVWPNTLTANSPILIFADKNRQVGPMDANLMKFISDTLHNSKPANNLNCDVKVRDIKQEKRFSDGVRTVEMLEVIFFTRSYMNVPDQTVYFPLDVTTVERSEINSRFAGLVEAFEVKANDMANSRFIFQHNGNGDIVWMSFEDDIKTVPCRLKNY